MQPSTSALISVAIANLLFVQCFAYILPQSAAKRAIEGPQEEFDDRQSSYRYYNDKTKEYFIKELPLVKEDLGEIYSGSVPISDDQPDRTLFFVFKPAINTTSNDLTIWLDGGPGCSSLYGFFQGNGPVLWQPGVFRPTTNPYTWALETNMLWVDQPVGTGFSQGQIRAKNEVDISKDFVGFFKNFQQLFGIENYQIYVTGASYAGRFVSYIAAEMLDQDDKTYYDLSGIYMADPTIGSYLIAQGEIPRYPFALANNGIIGLDQSTLDKLEAMHTKCGYDDYLEKYLTFPPSKIQPPLPGIDYKCQLMTFFVQQALHKNQCYNNYHITDYCPYIGDVIGGTGDYGCSPQSPPNTCYFNRTDVKRAIHAPLDISWAVCSTHRHVFKGGSVAGPERIGDLSPDPIQHVLPQVVEATNRVVVTNGNWDGLILTNGTLLSIQNMTWNGKLGFQKEPSAPFVVTIKDKVYGTGSQGKFGTQHCERGLCFIEVEQAGHQMNDDQPRATLQLLKYLIGKQDEL